MRVLTLFLMAGVVLALAVPAGAITLRIGDVEFWIEDRDNGTEYVIPGVGVPPVVKGASIGVTNNPLLGVPAMDLAGGTLPVGGIKGAAWAAVPWAIGANEDSWGVARTNQIKTPGGTVLWDNTTANTELVWIFYGAEDFYAENLNSLGSNVLTACVNLHAELWEEPLLGGTPLDWTNGYLNRTGLNTYTGVTESPSGLPLLVLDSVRGFIQVAGDFGGPATEFETQFNALSFTGQGQAYFDVVGGTMQTAFATGTISTPASGINGVPNCDAWAKFDSYPSPDGTNPTKPGSPGYTGVGPYDWLVKTGGQVTTNVIPEPVTMAGMLLGFGCLGRYIRKRR
jgi:hypothetical protein